MRPEIIEFPEEMPARAFVGDIAEYPITGTMRWKSYMFCRAGYMSEWKVRHTFLQKTT